MGFEPMIPFWGIHTFQACAFDHSAISPDFGAGLIHSLPGKSNACALLFSLKRCKNGKKDETIQNFLKFRLFLTRYSVD